MQNYLLLRALLKIKDDILQDEDKFNKFSNIGLDFSN